MARARRATAEILGVADPHDIVFTKNATESINIVLKGWLRDGDRVLISSLEHNAVVRPLSGPAGARLRVERIRCGTNGELDLEDLERGLDPPPRLVVLVHACNVNGALQPVPEAAALCARAGVPLLLDAAQTAGLLPILAADWHLGMVACSGHKALLGPPGVGILYIRPDLDVPPLMEGGTGTRSEEPVQPIIRPDRYESGTPNLPGIAGLNAGIEYIRTRGMGAILEHELRLAERLERELQELPGVVVQRPAVRGTGVVSFVPGTLNPEDVGHLLDEGFGIGVRTGLHCAPMAHRTLGSFPVGTVRVSPGYANSQADVDFFLEALRSLLGRRNRGLDG